MEAAVQPSHVLDSQFYDYDVFKPEAINGDYQLALSKLKSPDVPGIFWTPRNGGHWVLTCAEDIRAILNNAEIFSSDNITIPRGDENRPQMIPIEIDPPNHTKYRNLIAPFLSPKSVNALAIDARKLAIELIDGFKNKGECEFVSEFSTYLPVAIFMQIAGLPLEDRVFLQETSDQSLRCETEEEREIARNKIAAYGMKKIKERRGGNGTDLISAVANAKIDGELMDDISLTGMITLLLLAGLDTVASAMGFATRHLALNVEDRKRIIADPSLINVAVEEMLRRYPMVNPGREVKTDYLYKGVNFKKGDMVYVPTALDGLDEDAWTNAAKVDFDRKNNALHSTFGGGVHRCMGSMLARVELRIFVEEWLKRIPDFSIKPGHEIKVNLRQVAMINELPLVWDVT